MVAHRVRSACLCKPLTTTNYGKFAKAFVEWLTSLEDVIVE